MTSAPRRVLLVAAAWLAVALIALKASYLAGSDGWATDPAATLQSLVAISFADVVFVAVWWVAGRLLLAACERRQRSRELVIAFYAASAFVVAYAAAGMAARQALGGFPSYPLLALVGDVGMVRSSVAANLRFLPTLSIVLLPALYLVIVRLHLAVMAAHVTGRGPAMLAAIAALLWITFGQQVYATRWATRDDRRVADNANWVLISSWWETLSRPDIVTLGNRVSETELVEFEPPSTTVGRGPEQRPNVVLVVLESVGARWTSLTDRHYDSTPVLAAEAGHGSVFRNFYAHIGRSSNALAAILMSRYPKLGFRGTTEEYPRLEGTSLASLFQDRGYRTAFITPSDLAWANWKGFLDGRGFDALIDYHSMRCGEPVSSWGVEDGCMVDEMVRWIDAGASQPFFVMAWSQQTHHPYEPTPGVPLLTFSGEPVADSYDLGRYLNVLRQTDRRLGDLFAAIRRGGLDDNTLVVVVGDHGQAFGYPHRSYMQGHTIYEEDVRVPLLLWYSRLRRPLAPAEVIGGQLDLAPTIVDAIGWPAAPTWQGRSLLDPARPQRAYFYTAEYEYRLGVRDDVWKYIVDLRTGVEELYNLADDPDERRNVAAQEPARSAQLRQRVAAWSEANRRQYAAGDAPGRTHRLQAPE